MDIASIPAAIAQEIDTAVWEGSFPLYKKGPQRKECMLDDAFLHCGNAPWWQSEEEDQLPESIESDSERPSIMRSMVVSLAKEYHSKYALGSRHLLGDKNGAAASERMYPRRKAHKSKASHDGTMDQRTQVRRKSQLSSMTCRGDWWNGEMEHAAL